MTSENIKAAITSGQTALGVEFGSTTIKAVLTTQDGTTIASGSYDWTNSFQDGLWTYALPNVWAGLQVAYGQLKTAVQAEYGVTITKINSMGFSAMMHGYLVFDADDEQLVPFRTWRNAITADAARELTQLFAFNIPQRWSIAHLYQAILNQETHVPDIAYMTTLAGYVHWQLTDILPQPLKAGTPAGTLTEKGALLLDPTGDLQPGTRLAPPEGDAGTGMVATNSVNKRTGNISVGTSIFSMIVLEKPLAHVYSNIDIVTTPTGLPVAMVHANNSASDINAWAKLFAEFAQKIGHNLSTKDLYQVLFDAALTDATPDAGGLSGYGYYSGENITGVPEGRPLLVRQPDAIFSVGNLMRLHIFSAFGAIKIGMRLLADEDVLTDNIVAQGGVFKTPVVAQKLLAAALNTNVTVMQNAGEGGPWGMAILALYAANNDTTVSLADFLAEQIFADSVAETLSPDPVDVAGFETFMTRYINGFEIEMAAIKALPSQGKKE
ncbi:FGGY-family carbohydrate kinase [Leuconostoc lactis]|uniref:FGGY-family carbohydrate kinase n=1 Tax=Leuconostoc lactis TaxID=1246 RepID=UPI00241D6DE7|nr:FGGY-family carbohydrate kinase [Leuconostoc lactis]